MNTRRTPDLEDLSLKQRETLIAFRDQHGDGWKEVLAEMWRSSSDLCQPQGHHLRQVRNQFGPKWLSKI